MGPAYYHVKDQDFTADGIRFRGMIHGYIVTVQHKAHCRCGCLRGRSLTLFRPHPTMCGDWPMHYLAFDYLVSRELGRFTMISHAYGSMRADKLGLMFQHDDV